MDQSRYAELFLTESRDNLSAINHSLLELERSPDAPEHVGALFRAVHTVKGMSATMGYAEVAELSHELETVLDQVRRHTRRVTPALMDVLFRAADALERAIEGAVGGGDEGAAAELLALLRAEADAPPDSTPPTAEMLALPPGKGGIIVRVEQVPETPMRGVRAYLAAERARSLGTLLGASPPVDALQREQYGDAFLLRLQTDADDGMVERTILSAGGVARVVVDREGGARAMIPAAELEAAVDAEARAAALQSAFTHEAAQPRSHRYVRIDLQRLDVLMNLIGELVIARGRLVRLASELADPALEETVAHASRLVSDLQDGIMASRMVPAWQVFDRFPRLVRDAARALGKQVDFVVEGKEVELDRSVLDEIGDPIVHLLRNAIDHGLESAEARAAAGKPATGRLELAASRDRSSVVIRVTDDGRGIDRDRVLARAKELGLVPMGTSELTDDEVVRIIGRPGFSTASQVTAISGRGVGIDAVVTRIRALGGSVEIRTARGEGTQVTVRLPVTLAIVRALLARVGDETYAIPMTHVNETAQLELDTIRQVKGRDVLVVRNDVLPLMHLRDVVGLPRRDAGGGQVVVLEVADRRAGMVVDELTGQQEIVIKPFDAVKDGLSMFSGATILGDGVPALILDVSSLL